jgi:hypothetical protein
MATRLEAQTSRAATELNIDAICTCSAEAASTKSVRSHQVWEGQEKRRLIPESPNPPTTMAMTSLDAQLGQKVTKKNEKGVPPLGTPFSVILFTSQVVTHRPPLLGAELRRGSDPSWTILANETAKCLYEEYPTPHPEKY